ncbi:hypothetical protein HMPREF9419_0504 [Prevotella nigrescens ATCC 33563]|nr:hypothetical protein HMPREF9419_0504 [Prevotella nigrescens ATCC 33563]
MTDSALCLFVGIVPTFYIFFSLVSSKAFTHSKQIICVQR